VDPEALIRKRRPAGRLQPYVEEWSQPGTISAQINYYRAAIRRSHRGMSAEANPPIEAPTMVIWGENDRYGIPEMAYCENADVPGLERVEILPGASHWVQHDEPDRVGSLLIEFLDGRK
jgi:pimeloyl-ACP methyl ester carboxylesterase